MMAWEVREGDAVERLREFADGSVDAIVCDPPYGLEFMGKDWDRFADAPRMTATQKADHMNTSESYGPWGRRARPIMPNDYGHRNERCLSCGKWRVSSKRCECAAPQWEYRTRQAAPPSMLAFQAWSTEWAREALRVLKPGGHLLAFGGTRTYHRLACAVEDAGFEIRDEVLSIFEATEAGRQFLASLTPEQIAALDKLGGGPLAWLYGSGFPKSLDVSKAIDKAAGAEREVVGQYRVPVDSDAGNAGQVIRTVTAESMFGVPAGREGTNISAPATPEAEQWDGWGTALKPAHEPIVMARKPLVGTVAANVLEHGTGALNIAAARIPIGDRASYERNHSGDRGHDGTRSIEDRGATDLRPGGGSAAGERWPANVVLDEEAAAELDRQSGELVSGANPTRRGSDKFRMAYGDFVGQRECEPARGVDIGGASRFFYCAKASRAERNAGLDAFEKRPILWSSGEQNPGSFQADGTDRSARNPHPTVKPIEVMRWLIRLVTPPGGLVVDPFVGSGSTGCAAVLEGVRFVGVERDAEYVAIARARIEFWAAHPTELPVEAALAADAARRRVREGGQIGLDI